MLISTVTSKGTVTIPAKIRKSIGIKPTDKVTFKTSTDTIILERLPSLDSLFGSLANSNVKPLHPEEMDRLANKMFSKTL